MLNVNMLELDKHEKKLLKQALRNGCTVKEVREALVTGPLGTVIMTFLGVGLFLILGVIFLPFIFLAPVPLVMFPIQAAKANARWRKLLPEADNDKLINLVNGG